MASSKRSERVRERQLIRLVECGGALAEALLWTLKKHVLDEETADMLKTHLANWDVAVLEIPEEVLA